MINKPLSHVDTSSSTP